jgi:uncharacterized protein
LRLFLSGNPTATELLWLTDGLYETRTVLGDELIAIRGSLLSARRIRNAYLGYATQQLKRVLTRDGDEGREAPRKAAKHARHLMRLVNQGFELYTTGGLTIRLPDPERYRSFGEQVAEDAKAAAPFLAEAEVRFREAKSALPDEPDTAPAEAWLLRVRKQFWDAGE